MIHLGSRVPPPLLVYGGAGRGAFLVGGPRWPKINLCFYNEFRGRHD